MTSWLDYNAQNHLMVDKFTELAIITSKEVENAFRCVSRAGFVSKELLDEAFVDAPIRSAPHIHMSSPHLYATILENLQLEPGMSFLNIGSGTGYFSCLAGYMIKKHGINHGVELHTDLVEFSQKRIADVLKYGPSDTRDICPPSLIVGNCFQLDQSQMKYDRLYCGGSCSLSIITFFLGFLKVGGFLIAPNSTKLIKLERVGYNEGVKSVIRSVWFAPLTRLHPDDILKLRLGLLRKLRFPLKSKKQKPKKAFVTSTNFPMCRSLGRMKISKLRAIQDALDSLERDGSIPLPFCYVPQIDQMNAYKEQKNAADCNASKTKPSLDKPAPTPADEPVSNTQLPTPQLCTISEIEEGAAQYDNIMRDIETSTEGNLPSSGAINRPLFEAASPTDSSSDDEDSGNVPPNNGGTSVVKCKGSVNTANDEDEMNIEICSNIWEHLCADKLWKVVVENYYSLCTTSKERKDKCMKIKGRELVKPAATKLSDMLLFKFHAQKKKKKREEEEEEEEGVKGNVEESAKPECVPFEVSGVLQYNSSTTCDPDNTEHSCLEHHSLKCDKCKQLYVPSEEKENLSRSCADELHVKMCLEELVDNVCSLHEYDDDDEKQELEESIDSVISFQSLSASFQSLSSTDESLHNSFEKHTEGKETKHKRMVDIRTDDVTSDNLKYVQHHGLWTIDHDIELISYLVKYRKEPSAFPPKFINCNLFDKTKLIRHPLISSIPPSLLCYRSVALLRVVSILDCVLDVLIGPSLPNNQFDSPFLKERYPLESFLDSSFLPSDSQLNVLEAQNIRRSVIEESEDVFLYQEAQNHQDEELLKEVYGIISNESNNVKQQQLILVRKLELIDNINDQYKEQIKLLTQQIDLIEEQQQLLIEVDVDYMETVAVMTSSQQLVTDRKRQRYALIAKRDRIILEKMTQLAERKELLNMLEQLLSLETRLKQEMSSLEKKGMGYLRGEGNLSHFSQFVSKTGKIVQRLRVATNQMLDIMQKKFPSNDVKSVEATNQKVSLRYQPQSILPRCRFLLPLSMKRYSYILEMLRATERSPPEHIPIINVDRSTALNERHRNGAASTVFMQIYESLKSKDLNYRWNKKHEQWWEVRFSGEGIIDQGGGFRDSLVEMLEELCPPDPDVVSCLALFIKTPNQKSGLGDHLECYTLNPKCKQYNLYRWLGKLMGACFRSMEFFSLPLPPYIWKLIVGEYVYWKKDFNQIDEAAVRNIDGLANLDEDAYAGLCIEQTYSTILSDGTEMELVTNGSNIVVTTNERSKYSAMVRKARMLESCDQVKAVREGLISVIPEGILSCLTWKNLEKGVCGSPTISVADLKTNCRYGDDLKVTSQCVMHMWTALASFTEADRSRFIRFITGRKRLPSPFIVSRSEDKDRLPSASTCGSNLFLPEYSTLQIAKDKIKYAIYNCVAIDTDTSPW